jgi:L,D-transpeptidase YcbB
MSYNPLSKHRQQVALNIKEGIMTKNFGLFIVIASIIWSAAYALPNPAQDPRVQKVYDQLQGQMIWIKNGDWTPCGKTLLETLSHADEEGLWPEDYTPFVENLQNAELSSEEVQKQAEGLLTLAALNYISDMRGGRLSNFVSKDIFVRPPPIDGIKLLVNYFSNPNQCGWIHRLAPSGPEYQQLKQLLASYRQKQVQGEWSQLPKETKRQKGNKGPKASVEQRIRSIIVSLEKQRWFPHPLPARYLQVNIAGFYLKAVEGGTPVFYMPIITGKPHKKTPVFHAPMREIIFNPSWHVPPSIIKELMPKIVKNPGAFARKGYHVSNAGSGVRIVQSPGNGNALGKIRFTIDSPFAIYLHGTPQKNLFRRAKRALSHGCIRVENPAKLAEFVFQDPQKWSLTHIKAQASGTTTKRVKLAQPLPTYVTYFTVFEDEKGKMTFVEDGYGQDKQIWAALVKAKRNIQEN